MKHCNINSSAISKLLLFFIGTLSIFLFSLSTPFQLSAQSGNITGKVIDAETKKAVQRATVTIHNHENKKLIAGGYTDKSGNFNINVGSGNYFLVVKFVGYD